MKHSFPFREALTRFRHGMANREESEEVVKHLLRGCRDCQEALARIAQPSDPEPISSAEALGDAAASGDPTSYSTAFARVRRVVQWHHASLMDEAASVSSLLRELERHPRARQEVLASNSSRFQTWTLVEALLERARRLCQRDSEEADHLARLAILITGLLDPKRYGSARLHDLRGRAWSEWGNVLRLQERFRESEQAFNTAEDLLCQGTADPAERAAFLSLQASMWHDRRQFERAKRLLDRTISIARRVGQRHLHGVALIQKALCHSDQDQPEAALPLLLQAQRLLEPSTEPRLLFVVQQNIIVALTKAGRFQEAAAGLDGVRALCLDRDYPIDLIRIEYVEAMILHGLGRVQEAESRFRSAFDGMLAEGLDFDAALVGLDLATLLSQQNRFAEVRELAAAMLPVFTSHRIHREAIAALLIFKEAVQREQLSTKLVEELSTYLHSAASDPTLRFQPPAWLKSTKS